MRVLVVDDSAYQRITLATALRELPLVVEVETVSSGSEAIKRAVATKFDLVTLDLEMPGMDGFAVLRWLMQNRPLPVLIVSDRRHDRSALTALELGAFEVIGKAATRSGGLAEWKKILASNVEEASQLRVDLLTARARKPDGESVSSPGDGTAVSRSPVPTGTASGSPAIGALVVASSTGGPPALRELFGTIPRAMLVVGVAQHMPAPFTRSLAQRLSQATGWPSREAADNEEAVPGTIFLAPGGRHLRFEKIPGRVICKVLPPSAALNWCPSGDELFASAAAIFGARTIAIVLTGMGDDGSDGVKAVSQAGGSVLCESRETAVIPGMPDAAARAVPSARRAPLGGLGAEVGRILKGF